jgi:hypothetical protein
MTPDNNVENNADVTMNCSDFEILLCDYVDGTLDAARKQALEAHMRGCAACAEFARDVTGAVAFMERAEDVVVPQELLTRIAFHIPESAGRTVQTGGVRALFAKWLQPVLQPRFAMGMAMTILSFSMVARFAGIEPRQLKAADLSPTKVWAVADDRIHRSWQRAVKYYDSLRLVYEVQSRYNEWTQQEDEDRKTSGVDNSGVGSKPAEGQSRK